MKYAAYRKIRVYLKTKSNPEKRSCEDVARGEVAEVCSLPPMTSLQGGRASSHFSASRTCPGLLSGAPLSYVSAARKPVVTLTASNDLPYYCKAFEWARDPDGSC